tara:strand:+ start:59759 stop:61210 length:1452 start_codon:yes stop_codon:yes gene_type:complete
MSDTNKDNQGQMPGEDDYMDTHETGAPEAEFVVEDEMALEGDMDGDFNDMDFDDSDLDGAYDGEYDDEFDDGGQAYTQTPVQGKKKSGFVFYILIALIVLGALWFIATSLFGGEPSETTSQFPQTEQTQSQENALPTPDVQAVVVEEDAPSMMIEGFDNPFAEQNSNAVNQAAAQAEATNVIPPVITDENAQADMSMEPAQVPDEMQIDVFDDVTQQDNGTVVIENTDNEDFPSPANIVDAVEDTMADLTGAEPMPEAQPAQVEEAPIDNAIVVPPTADETVQDVAQTVNQTMDTQAVDEVMVSETVSADNKAIIQTLEVISNNIIEMQATLATLDSRVNTLEKSKSTSPSSAQVMMDTPENMATTSQINTLQKSIDRLATRIQSMESAPAPIPSASAPAPVAKPTPAPTPTPILGRTQTQSAPLAWELQSAEPGRAWLARAGSAAYIPVRVGDSLPGFGKVTFIGQRNGRWVVEGPDGVIQE